MRVEHLAHLIVSGSLLFLPSSASAQSESTATIAGVVRDTTGAVLPGVTVEASSPALIEKVRTAVTDGQGQYKIVDLRPGTYAVTFTLTGFSVVKREGLELTTGFTAAANADLRVGSVEETITVTGASPVVDTQNVRTQNVLSRAVLDSLPTGQSLTAFATLTLGATGGTGDVGGNKGEFGAFGFQGATAGDARVLSDGMVMAAVVAGAGPGSRMNFANQFAVEEVAMTVRGASAETEVGGPLINFVPKEGGNAYAASFAANGAGSAMQSKRLTDELRSWGITEAPSIKKVYDTGGNLGGPIKQDRLWFFAAARRWNADEYQPGAYFQNKSDPAARGGLLYVASTRLGSVENVNWDVQGRLTWQVAPKHKVAISQGHQHTCYCHIGLSATRVPEATVLHPWWSDLTQVSWNFPASNRLLFEGGFTGLLNETGTDRPEGVSRTDIAVTDLVTGVSYNARADTVGQGGGFQAYNYDDPNSQPQANGRFAISYVTGSHAFKTGITALQASQTALYALNDPPVRYFFRSGVPFQIQQWTSPIGFHARVRPNLGVFAQDQWTLRRLTLNVGLRFDHFNAYTEAEQLPAGAFAPVRDVPANHDVPNFKDVNPRFGAAYDLFGQGKTAVKVSLGRYVKQESTQLALVNHPAYRVALNATRTWNDAQYAAGDPRRDDYVPDCDLTNPLANGECGQLSNLNLGRTIPSTTFSEDVTRGFGQREYSWQGTLSAQHELRPNMAVSGSYYRVRYGNLTVTDNRLVAPSDFDTFCITAPSHAQLPGGGGYQVCGLYDIKPASFGRVDDLVTQASNFGGRTRVYNGFDLNLTARFGAGGFVQGGVATGRTVEDNCAVVDVQPQFCNTPVPFKANTQYKGSINYPLPWYGIQASGTFQNLAGPSYVASFSANNAAALPSLGRNLSGGSSAVQLIEPGTLFGDRWTQIDTRLSKIVRLGRTRIQGNLDIYNVLNTRAILAVNGTFGSNWLRPTSILGGRMFKFGGQVEF